MKTLSDYVRLAPANAVPLIAFKASADVVSKLVTLLVTVAVARELAPPAFGVFALAMTTGWLMGVATDLGLPLYLARATAQQPRGTGGIGALVRHVIRLRVRLALVALGIAVLGAWLWVPRPLVGAFLVIVGAQLAGAVLETIAHVFRGLERSDIESRIVIAHRVGTALLVLIALGTGSSLAGVAWALAVPPTAGMIVAWVVATRLVGVASGSRPSRPATIWREALPIGIGILLSALYFRCDVYFVQYWHGLEDVGRYNAVFRLIEALRLFPAAVLAVMFPALCRTTTVAPVRRLSLTLGAGGALAMTLVFGGASWIVGIVYGPQYVAAVPALQILAFALPLFFVNYALTHQVIAWNGQRAYVMVTALALVTNVTANALLIPSQGIAGAATATVITEFAVLAGCAAALRMHLTRREEGAALAVPNTAS